MSVWAGVMLSVATFAIGVGITRWLMRPLYCPRCGEYMKGHAREVLDWMRRHKGGE